MIGMNSNAKNALDRQIRATRIGPVGKAPKLYSNNVNVAAARAVANADVERRRLAQIDADAALAAVERDRRTQNAVAGAASQQRIAAPMSAATRSLKTARLNNILEQINKLETFKHRLSDMYDAQKRVQKLSSANTPAMKSLLKQILQHEEHIDNLKKELDQNGGTRRKNRKIRKTRKNRRRRT